MARPVTVRLFGPAREAAGTSSLAWPVPAQGVRTRDLVAALARDHPRLAPTLRVSRFLVNGEVVGARARWVRPGDEFAVHPPYGGG